jgi:hypothetical protein
MFLLLNEHAGHRLAASAVVVDETAGGTSDFPCANRNRSGSGVCCGFVAAFDGKVGAAFLAQEPEVPAGFSHGRSLSAMPRVCPLRMGPVVRRWLQGPEAIGDSGGDPRRHAPRLMVVVHCERIWRAGPVIRKYSVRTRILHASSSDEPKCADVPSCGTLSHADTLVPVHAVADQASGRSLIAGADKIYGDNKNGILGRHRPQVELSAFSQAHVEMHLMRAEPIQALRVPILVEADFVDAVRASARAAVLRSLSVTMFPAHEGRARLLAWQPPWRCALQTSHTVVRTAVLRRSCGIPGGTCVASHVNFVAVFAVNRQMT